MSAALRLIRCGCSTPCRPTSSAPATARSAATPCWPPRGGRPMSLDALRDQLPAYAKDLALNLGSLAGETLLSEQQKWGAFVASAHAVAIPAVVKAIEAAAAEAGLSDEAKTAAKTAAAIMGMNNVYYRALHIMQNDEDRRLPARLRMNVLANP